MSGFEAPAWGEMFIPDGSLAESILRGSVIYLALVVFFRVILKRQTGSLGLPDVMLVVLVSECVSESLSAGSHSIPNALAAVGSLLFWNYALDRLAHRWPWLQRRLEPEPLVLVRDGKPLRENLAQEGITGDELASQLRINGIDDVSRVKLACLEPEGAVSVIPMEEGPPEAPTTGAAPTPGAPDIEGIAGRFLAVAAELQKAVEWHEGRAAQHRAAAKAARQLLTARRPRPTPRHPSPPREPESPP